MTDDNTSEARNITLQMIKKWHKDIKTDNTNRTINTIVQAFHAALNHISDKFQDSGIPYKVEGSFIFNAVMQLCVLEMGPAIKKYLRLSPDSKLAPHKSKKFKKIKNTLKLYLRDLLLLLSTVNSLNIQIVFLKHLHYMSIFLNSYPETTKKFIKQLIKIWGNSEDAAQVLAFLCILRLIRNQSSALLDKCLKLMYVTYLSNSKFMNINSLASINFMRRSLVELFNLDYNVTYINVFLYIRQLAIQLRNAITLKKKENYQSVYNWQFVNSLRLWGMLLALSSTKEPMKHLVYPFVQVCLGTIKLIPTSTYYPLRFHVIQILIDYSKATDAFIPILPLLLEVLTSYDFDKKSTKGSLQTVKFTCLLRLSKSQIHENATKDIIIDTIFTQLLENLTLMSHTVSFPDLSLLCTIQIKQFLKSCKTSKYTRKLKQILDKIRENSEFIEKERSYWTINLSDNNQIRQWESEIKTKGTPLAKFSARLQMNTTHNVEVIDK